MKQDRLILRWALLTSLLSTGLGVAVNLATDLKSSWLAWGGVVALTVLSGVASFVVQKSSARKKATEVANSSKENFNAGSRHPGDVVDRRDGRIHNDISGTVKGLSVQAGTVHGDVHIHHIGRRTLLTVTAFSVVVAMVVVVVLNYFDRSTGNIPALTTTQVAVSRSSTAPPGPIAGPLEVTASWPLARGCDGGTAVAMVNGGPDVRTFAMDGHERQRMIDAGGGVWGSGFLYLDLTTKPHKSLRILNLRPLIDKVRLPPPTWVYSPGGGCGGPMDRHFALNLDKPSLTDEGIEVPDYGASVPGMRGEPIGPEFTISTGQPATLRFDVTGCKANYQWSLEITYSVDGDSGKQTYVSGPYRSMGFADNTTMYTLGASGSYATAGVLAGPSNDDWCTGS